MPKHGYATARQAYAVIAPFGSALTYCDHLAKQAGLKETDQRTGAIGLVETGQVLGWALGLCVKPGHWAVKADWGVMFHVDFRKAWIA